jgi:acetyl/propionyl-CoA carboxylase alpha subunit
VEAVPTFRRLLVANRGEVAVRVLRAASDLGIATVAVVADDDTAHGAAADEAVALGAGGPAAYLDIARLLAIARQAGCDAVHPGWGFLSERADFCAACADAGLVFVGPTPAQLALFGDKVQALALARECGVPTLPATGTASLAEAQAFMAGQGGAPVMLKALGGGGGRGLRAVHDAAALPAAYARCASEARSFGVAGVYVERLLSAARHVEVQVVGDGQNVLTLGDRECSLQRRFQKLVEVAPAPLPPALRQRLAQAALAMARQVGYRNLGTFEFLVEGERFYFIEANPRLQVEHTVTEAVTGLDLVALQLGIAAGATLAALGLDGHAGLQLPRAQGCAVQWRINAETLDAQGQPQAATGTPTQLTWPTGPGLRIDTSALVGVAPSPHYDMLYAKLVVHAPRWTEAVRRSRRALAACGIAGLDTNLPLLRALAARPEFEAADWHAGSVAAWLPTLMLSLTDDVADVSSEDTVDASAATAVTAGRLLQWLVDVGDEVAAGTELAVVEAMKMEHALHAAAAGRVAALCARPGDAVQAGQVLARLLPVLDADEDAGEGAGEDAVGTHAPATPAVRATPGAPGAPATPRADLQRLHHRLALTQDAARPEAVAKRHALGLRTARENIADLCDAGSFDEFGALAVAAQSARRSAEDLQRNTPADGMVCGIGSINGAQFGPERSRAVVMAYDATVLAGTQGFRNHQKTDRLLALALRQRLPVVLFAEGGGGRPGDTDMPIVAGLHVGSFASHARLSGQVPLVGIAAGRCFAGNAALLGCCDVIIATRGSNIGMGGPAMIEGGGLGRFSPEDIGPAGVQAANGVIDLRVDDEAQAVAAARLYVAYFQGALTDWTCADPARLREAVPENRRRSHDVRRVLHGLFDSGSVLELRAGFGASIVTALARLEGRPVGVLAGNPQHLGGAIDADAADKAARFMQLCNAHGLALVSLIDTPGFMVGPEAERRAQVRHAARLFVTAAALRVPFFSVVLRRAFGLGAMGLAAGGFHEGDAIVAWPGAEFGAMGLEGAVRLGWRKELAAQPEGAARDALWQELLARQVEAGSALNMAATLEIDAVIDPAATRGWLVRGLAGARVREGGARFIDTW